MNYPDPHCHMRMAHHGRTYKLSQLFSGWALMSSSGAILGTSHEEEWLTNQTFTSSRPFLSPSSLVIVTRFSPFVILRISRFLPSILLEKPQVSRKIHLKVENRRDKLKKLTEMLRVLRREETHNADSSHKNSEINAVSRKVGVEWITIVKLRTSKVLLVDFLEVMMMKRQNADLDAETFKLSRKLIIAEVRPNLRREHWRRLISLIAWLSSSGKIRNY